MKELHSPNVPHDLEYSPDGIGIVDGVGYINMFFTQNSQIPKGVTIELEDAAAVEGEYDEVTGHYSGTFLPSYGDDNVYHVKGKAINDKGTEALIEYEQAINIIPGMELEVTNVRVTEDSLLIADLSLRIASNIRRPERIFPALVSTFVKGTAKRVSTVSWDSKTNRGHVGFKLCADCSAETLRVVQSTLEVDNKLIDFSIHYLTPAVNIERKGMSVKDGIVTINYKFNGGNSQIPFVADIRDVKVFEKGVYPTLVDSVESSYSHRYGTLDVKIPVTLAKTGKIDHVITGVFFIDGGTITRPLKEEITSYLETKGVDILPIQHYVGRDKKTEVASFKCKLQEGGFPVALNVDEITGFEGRAVKAIDYRPDTGILNLMFETEFDPTVKTKIELVGIVSFPDYGDLSSRFSNIITPKFYLFPPKVKLVENSVIIKDGRQHINIVYDIRFNDGSIPEVIGRGKPLRDITFGDIRNPSEIKETYNGKTGRGTICYPIKDFRYITGKVGVTVDFTFAPMTKDLFSFRFGDLVKVPFQPQILNKEVTVDKENKKLTISFIGLEANGQVPDSINMLVPFHKAEGVIADSVSGNTFSIVDGSVEVTFDIEDPELPIEMYKFKTDVYFGHSQTVAVLDI